MAVLLEDGRICRIGYSEELPPLPAVSNLPVPVAPANKEKRWVWLMHVLMNLILIYLFCSDDDASTSSARMFSDHNYLIPFLAHTLQPSSASLALVL